MLSSTPSPEGQGCPLRSWRLRHQVRGWGTAPHLATGTSAGVGWQFGAGRPRPAVQPGCCGCVPAKTGGLGKPRQRLAPLPTLPTFILLPFPLPASPVFTLLPTSPAFTPFPLPTSLCIHPTPIPSSPVFAPLPFSLPSPHHLCLPCCHPHSLHRPIPTPAPCITRVHPACTHSSIRATGASARQPRLMRSPSASLCSPHALLSSAPNPPSMLCCCPVIPPSSTG